MAIIKVDYGEISGGGTVKTGTSDDISNNTGSDIFFDINVGLQNIGKFILFAHYKASGDFSNNMALITYDGVTDSYWSDKYTSGTYIDNVYHNVTASWNTIGTKGSGVPIYIKKIENGIITIGLAHTYSLTDISWTATAE